MLLEIDEVWIPDRLKDDKDGIRQYINHISLYFHNFVPAKGDEVGNIYTLRQLYEMNCLDACFLTSLWKGPALAVEEAVEEIERLDHALRRIAQYEGFEPAKDHDHCCLIARHALYPE